MPNVRRPRKGSIAYSPRVRAPRPSAHMRAWPASASVGLQGLAGYKAGMVQVFVIDDRKNSLTSGQEIMVPATVIEVPPVLAYSVKLYKKTTRGLKEVLEVRAKELPKQLSKKVSLPKKYDPAKFLEKAEKSLKDVADVRILVSTQPWKSNMPKKSPDLVEIRVGGASTEERWNFAKGLLGKEVKASEVFKEGEFVDVLAITKGKGFQGPVKRWGIKLLPRKTRGGRRQVGSIGPWKPTRLMWTVPFAGQMGFHQRTEFNKRIIKMGSDGKEVTPEGGFLRYGVLRGDFVVLQGSVPGPTKRLVQLRQPMRAPSIVLTGQPTVIHVNTASPQGV